ncbi:MAG TPA: response regulator transcription factor, partial [Solimonas sp.]|nr:response regulator transcription factor [Solimonas sp.]
QKSGRCKFHSWRRASRPEPFEVSQPPTISILLADDHAMMRDGLRALLEVEPDLKVLAAVADGIAAVAAAAELQPHIGILDIDMPGLSGLDAARRIAEVSPATRILILSVHGNSEYIYRALQVGARGYVLKEAAGSQLVAAVRTVHSGRRFLADKVKETVIGEYLGGRRPQGPVERLSKRERSVLEMLVDGRSNGEVAKQLSISAKTVATYRTRMMKKLGINDMPALVRFAIAHGLTHGA